MKYSEAVGKNYFEMPSKIPGVKLMYYVDYSDANGVSRSKTIFAKHGLRVAFKFYECFNFPFEGEDFALVGGYIRASHAEKFEECMDELERSSSLYCVHYTEARIHILDEVVVMKDSD